MLIGKRILGVIFIILGLAALFTPFTPGSWLALIGLQLLGFGFLIPKSVSDRMERIKEKVKEKWRKRKDM